MVDLLATILAVIAFGMTVFHFTKDIFDQRRRNESLRNDAIILCNDLKSILTGINDDDDEEVYEIDLSLETYFDNNAIRIQDIITESRKPQKLFTRKDKKLVALVKLLEWLMNEFHSKVSDEEERIRIWSKNIPEFHAKLSNSLNNKPKIITN